ncbi:transglycosylase SLT domain-containing protein [Intestinibacter sp.]|uniref:transglycosylase SLT domain-containing protein n=1 Tax=Intestinibacter sp. TaxID=1965304 RepID=UPI003F145F23
MVNNKSSRFNLFEEYKVGGKFTPKKSQLVKNAENQNTKRDMRKKFIKSDRSTYTNNRVRKNQEGGILDNQISIDPNLFSSWNAVESNIEIPTNDTNIPETKLDRFMELLDSRPSISPRLFDIDRINTEIQDNSEAVKDDNSEIKNYKPKMDMTNPSKGTEEFNRIYDEVEEEYPEAAKYRAFLTTVAKYESGFNSKAKNKNAPAWGYFQFMQDDNKYNNIKTYAGVDTQTFLDNPKLQIIAAINLAKSMERGFSKEDVAAAESKGITKWGMLGGAWLGGNGGLRRYLLKDENISDKHWGGAGIDMINQIKRYNF